MRRIGDTERLYAMEALENAFRASKGSMFNALLERETCKRFDVPFAIPHVNGTATMHTALAALGVGPGDEVIVPPLTMASTAFAALYVGAVPVFADVDPETFTLSPDAVRAVLSPRTKAMIPVSVYGLPPDYDGLLAICRESGVAMVEDNAECFLATYKGKMVGQFGEFASYSFQGSKHVTCGNGGILTVRDEALANKARRFGNLGYSTVGAKTGAITKDTVQDPNFARHVSLGHNYRLSEIAAAVACAQMERVEELVKVRIGAAATLARAVGDRQWFRPQAVPADRSNAYWTYSCVLDTPDPAKDWPAFRKLFLANGGDRYYAAWMVNYLEPVFREEVQKRPGVTQRYASGLCPVAERLQARMIQFKTNYWDPLRAERQADILAKTLDAFGG
jgi:perosamine synthetase